MYKDVWKRILALALAVCLIGTAVQWPETVMAAETKSYHTYQHGSGTTSGNSSIEANTVGAVFTVGKNSSGGAEILDSIGFYAHINGEGKDTKATVSFYTNPQGAPDTGKFVHATTLNSLQEGTNTVDADMESYELNAGTTIGVVVSLEGANLAYYGGASAGQTYVYANNSWLDASVNGQCAAIYAYTYDVGDDGEDGNPGIMSRIASALSFDDEAEYEVAATSTGNVELNKTNLVIPKGGVGYIDLNNATGNVSWSVANESIALIYESGSTAEVHGLVTGETEITAKYDGVTYTCKVRVTSTLEDATITISPENATSYDGARHAISVGVKIGDSKLEEGKDYTVSCVKVDEQNVEIGGVVNLTDSTEFIGACRYCIKVTGKGEYSGTNVAYYVISPKQITDASIEVTLGTWDAANPTGYIASIVDTATATETSAGTTLTAADYTLETVTNDAGEVTGINIVGQGNYTGTRTCVTPKSIANAQVTFDQSTYVYLGREWQPVPTVAVDGVVISREDYTVSYVNNVDVGTTATATIKGQNGYYGQIQASFEIVPKHIGNEDHLLVQTPVEITVSDTIDGVDPEVEISYNGNSLVLGTDYTVSCVPDAAGTTGKCTITGVGNFTGTYEEEYDIVEYDITDYITSIEVADVVYNGEPQTPAVILKGTNVDELVEGNHYTVSYERNTDAGTATVTLRGIGAYSGKMTTTFEIVAADLSGFIYQFVDESTGKGVSEAAFGGVEYSLNKEDMKPQIIVKNDQTKNLTEGKDYKLTYSIDNTDVRDDLSAGLTITVERADGNTNYTTATKTLTYKVNKANLKTAIENGTIVLTLSKENFNYTGDVQKPEVTLAYASGNKEPLRKNTDYTVSYSDAAPTDAGTYKVMITGVENSNYTGYVEREFRITPVDIANIKNVTPDITQIGYVQSYKDNGGTWFAMKWFDENTDNNELKLVIVNDDGYSLQEGTASDQKDYLLSYENIKDVSTSTEFAKVTITGTGNYDGERTIFYLLAGKLEDYEVSVANKEIIYTGKPIDLEKENVTVTVKKGYLWWKETLTQGEDYKVVYTNNTNAGTASFTIEQLDDAELPTATGCYRYSDTITDDQKLNGTFKISPKNISDEATITLTNAIAKPYEGSAVTLTGADIPLTYGDVALEENTDYEIVANSYNNNTSASNDASVTINGIGNFTGTRVLSFAITGKSLANVKAEVEAVAYIGPNTAVYPAIISLETEDGVTLEKDVHYTYDNSDYENNTNAGTGTITIHGLKDYLGSETEIPFTIDPRDISDTSGICTFEGVAASYTYTSQEIAPKVVMKYQVSGASATTLNAGTDYTISYRDNVNCTDESRVTDAATEAAVVITGKGNYTGTVEKTFEIEPKNIEDRDAVVVADIPSQPYDGGKDVTPKPQITYTYGSSAETYQLSDGDYTLAYANQNGVGPATITITGQGNFTGTRTVNYHIGDSITDASKISISCPELGNGTTFIYKGSEYTPAVVVTDLSTGAQLEKDKDYTVSYENNIDAGTATISVEGIDTYAGVKEFTFKITPKNLADSNVALQVEGVADGSYKTAYTGSPVEPKVALTYNGKVLAASEYTVAYSGTHTAVGIVNVTVTAKADGNFTGSKTVQNTAAAKYEIVAANIGSTGFTMEKVEPQPLGSNGKATPTPKLYYNGVALVAGTDYTYSYVNNSATGTGAVVILTGSGNYTGTVRQTFEIRGNIADATIVVPESVAYSDYVTDNGDGTYTVDDIVFEDDQIVVTDGVKTLTQGVDYTISYADNTWVGVATITIKGMGSYAGSVTKNFMITAKLTEDAVKVTIGEQKFTGSAVKAIPVVEYCGKALSEGDHFIIVKYTDNTNVTDSATVTIMGNDNNGFSGTRTETFSITVNADTLQISGVAETYMYRGEAIEPSIVVKAGNVTLSASDYDVYYGTNTNVGTGTVSVIGKGNYDGYTKVATFTIEPQDINSLIVLDGTSNTFADREYTGFAIMPEVGLTTTIGGTTYKMGESDFTVTAKTDNVSVGTVTLELTGTGNVTGTREVTFDITPKSLAKDDISIQVTQNTFAYDGTAKTPSVIVTYQYDTETEVPLQENIDYTVGYSNNTAAGTATVTITGIGNYTGAKSANFTITAQDMSAAVITLPGGNTYTYMGNIDGVEPEVEVTMKGVALTKDKDYTVSYQNNKVCGTATVTVTGKGDFNGIATTTFTIEEHSIKDADVVVQPIPNQAYTGLPIVPELTITCGNYQLVKGVDFTVTCTGNTERGQASVTIKGIGGFKDSRTELFRIASNISGATVEGVKDSYTYTGQPLTEEQLGITSVQLDGTVLSASDYEVGYAAGCDGMSVGKQTVVLTGTGENYGGTKTFEITITPKNISDADIVMTGFVDNLPYTPNLTQDITLTWGTITLQRGTDYEVACKSTGTAGTYTMTVTGTGNYAGTIQQNFTVEQAAVDSLEFKDISSNYTYSGEAIEPKPTVLLGGVELKEGVDYTLTYLNNVNVGVATMTITGTGTAFAGEKEIAFTILRRSINHGTFGEIKTQVYTGKDVTPTVTVTDNGKTLVENADYTLMYKNNLRTGTASVVVAGKGNYTSTKTIPFAIRPCNATSLTVTGKSNKTVSLSWKGEGVVTGYEIYRMGANGKWQLVGGTKGTTYTDAKLSAGTSYSYKIRSYVVEDGETYYGEFTAAVKTTTSK